MSAKMLSFCVGILWLTASTSLLRADVLEMQNGDRLSGKVLSMSAETVVLNSEMLGKVNVPRSKVVAMSIGTNSVTGAVVGQPYSAAARPAVSTPPTSLIVSNTDLSASLRQLGTNTNLLGQIRQQMFTGNPEGAAKYDDLVNSLMSGQMNLNDLKQQARASAAQLRELKKDMPEAGDSLDEYLKILDAFINDNSQ